MNESSGCGSLGSLTSKVLKPKRPVSTSTCLPSTLSNLPSTTWLVPGTRVTYFRLSDIAAPGGGCSPRAPAGATSIVAHTAANAAIRLMAPVCGPTRNRERQIPRFDPPRGPPH